MSLAATCSDEGHLLLLRRQADERHHLAHAAAHLHTAHHTIDRRA